MDIQVQRRDSYLVFFLRDRFDAYAAKQMEAELEKAVGERTVALILEMGEVSYLSSAGVRVLVAWHKRMAQREGLLALVSVQGYCRDVIEMTGFGEAFAQYGELEKAEAQAVRLVREKRALQDWERLEVKTTECGSFRFIPGADEPTVAEILGDVRDVLHSSITADKIYSKKFFDKEYSIGMGGLGGHLEDYYKLLGEMVTIGGVMVWLPTDGHDTADFLIPKADKGDVMIRTGFNVSVRGLPNEYIRFTSSESGGTAIGLLYRELFSLARERRKDFRGALGLVIRAQMPAVYGSGIKKSAVTANKPENDKMIIHESNQQEWFDSDVKPRHTNVTALIVGIGADLTYDLSDYSEEDFSRVFYLHPVNIGARRELLHNHGVLFSEQPMAEKAIDIEKEIAAVIRQGDFIDMRHLLDSSTISEALIAVCYLHDFRTDPEGHPADQPDQEHPMPGIVKNQMKYYQA